VHGVTRLGIARLNTDGTLDTSFDPSTNTRLDVRAIALQPDGKLIVQFENASAPVGLGSPTLVRLNADGSRDLSLDLHRGISLDGADDGTGQATNRGDVSAFLLQPDGKIVVVGYFYYIVTGPGTSAPRSGIARFNGDGTFDPSFDPGAGFGVFFGTAPQRIVRQTLGADSGKLVVQGNFETFDGYAVDGFVRLHPNGSYDNMFHAGIAPADPFTISGLMLQSDDKIVVYGSFLGFAGDPRSGIVRLQSGGAVDGGFVTPSFEEYGEPGTISVVVQQADGRLVVGGFFHSVGGVAAPNVARLAMNGDHDPTFQRALPTAVSTRSMRWPFRPSDNKVFIGGYFATFGGAIRNNLAWLSSDGALEPTFNGLPGAIGYAPTVHALATQSDGKILVGGFFSSLDGMPRHNVVRLNPDASLDSSFGQGLVVDGSVRAFAIQPDGKIVIVGAFRAVNGVRRGRVVRLNPDGTVDTSFNPTGTGADATINAVMLDSQGSVYVGGAFTNFNGTPKLRIAKLTASGTPDPNFGSLAQTTSFIQSSNRATRTASSSAEPSRRMAAVPRGGWRVSTRRLDRSPGCRWVTGLLALSGPWRPRRTA
jgi:uncharacterized delta-60 repeat protein